MTEPTNEQLAAIEAFRMVARRCCAEIEAASESTDIGFLRLMNASLPELYWRAQALPQMDPWAGVTDEEIESAAVPDPVYQATGELEALLLALHESWFAAAAASLRALFGTHDSYRFVFDPLTGTERIEGLLSTDLAEVYVDLKTQLYLDEASDQTGETFVSRLWHWRWSFENHWGQIHLVSALKPIAWLVYQSWDCYDQAWNEQTA